MHAKLALAIRHHAASQPDGNSLDRDTIDLLLTLARIVELEGGQVTDLSILKAFGSPGDWGYNTLIGAALAHAYRCPGC